MRTFLNVISKLTYSDYGIIKNEIRKSIDKLNNSDNPIRAGQSVAVKVNIVGAFVPETAACTHPQIVKAVAETLKEIGAVVKIVEDCYEDNAPDVSGIKKIAEDTGCEFINLRDTLCDKIEINNNIYEYYRELLECDHLILVPKLKTHLLTNFSGAIKLMYGAIPKKQRVYFHKYIEIEDFSEILVDIFSIRKPSLVIMDAIYSMEGSGPTHGKVNESGVLLISDDAVMMDYYSSMLIKHKPLEIETTKIALRRGLASCKPEDVEMIGEKIEDIQFKFLLLPVLRGEMRKRYIKLVYRNPIIDESLCVKCGICIESCPFNALEMKNYPILDKKKCGCCYCCVELCTKGAFSYDMDYREAWKGKSK